MGGTETMRRPIFLVLLLVTAGACGGGPAPTGAPVATSSPTLVPTAAGNDATIVVSVPLGGQSEPAIGGACGISNIPPAYYGVLGANAKVKNESGTIVGAATIPQTGVAQDRTPKDLFDKNCVFQTKVTLIGSANFYQLDLGSAFDTTAVSRADLEAAGWRLSVGW